MAKKSFKDAASASIQVPKIAQSKPSKEAKEVKEVKEKRKVTTVLMKPSLYKRFKITCIEKDLKVGDELEGMFNDWLKKNEE